MNILVYADPAFRDTLWCTHTLRGIREEAKRKKHALVLLEDIPDPADSLRSRFGKGKAVVIVMGALVGRLRDRLDRLWKADIHTVLVNFKEEIPFSHSSTLIMDYAGAVRQGMTLLERRGAEKIALFGIGRDSGPDEIKKRTFLEAEAKRGIELPENAVFYMDDGLTAALDRFLSEIDRYDGILFGNDIAAMALTRLLRERGMVGRFPMVGFADPTLTDFKILLPDVTSLSASHREFGQQAVNLYIWLVNTPQQISVTVHIPIEVEGADDNENPGPLHTMSDPALTDEVNDDPIRNEILAVERCIRGCDATDLSILRSLFDGKTKAEIADEVFLTERAIKYRLKKLCQTAGVGTQKQLIAELYPWLCGLQ